MTDSRVEGGFIEPSVSLLNVEVSISTMVVTEDDAYEKCGFVGV